MTDKFEFIEAECAIVEAQLPTIHGCAHWWGCPSPVTTSGASRPVSAAQQRRELLAEKIRALFKAFDATYGYRRIHAELLRGGERVGPSWSPS